MRILEYAAPVCLWLFLFKILYFGLICGALWVHSDFDEEKRASITEGWFSPAPTAASSASSATNHSTQAVHETGASRHFQTWDAQHYLYLSHAGYARGVKSCAFYPLWPLMIRWFSVLTYGNHVIAGMLLANIFSLAGWTIFYYLCARRFGERVAVRALVLLIVFPGSLFYQFIYSEPLFFVLVMLLWLGLERERYGLALSAACLLPLCRSVGIFCVLPIAWHLVTRWPLRPLVWLQEWGAGKTKGGPRAGDKCSVAPQSLGRDIGNNGALPSNSSVRWHYYGLLTAPLLGLAAYLVLMWSLTGNALEGFQAQRFWGVHSITNLINAPKFVIQFLQPTAWHDFRGSVLDRCAFLLLLYCLPLIWRLGKDLMAWTCMLGILPGMSGTFTSFTRFESTVFPLFIALALFFVRSKGKWPLVTFVVASAAAHVILLWRFVNFHWAG